MLTLNKKQDQAAGFLYGICSVLAVPGSGKTTVMKPTKIAPMPANILITVSTLSSLSFISFPFICC